MTVLNSLASALGRRDQKPNVELARRVAARLDQVSVKALTECLSSPQRPLRHDAIKVLYEVGEAAPALIAPYLGDFVALLDGRDNRLVWGAMCALHAIASVRPAAVYRHLDRIDDASTHGSVITRDYGVRIMVRLASRRRFTKSVLPRLASQLQTCPTNQLPMYAELVASDLGRSLAGPIVAELRRRTPGIGSAPKRKRVERAVLRLESGMAHRPRRARVETGPGPASAVAPQFK